MPSLASGR